jgi:hypothetical protein
MANRSATRKTPYLVLLLSAIILCTQAFPAWSADSRRLATAPALSVRAGGQTGIVHYVVPRSTKTLDKGDRQFSSMK